MSFCGTVQFLENNDLGNDHFLGVLDAATVGELARPAQFVMLRAGSQHDPLLGRPFSIAQVERGPRGTTVGILYKVTGRGTAVMAELKPGATVHMVGPLGRPFPDPADDEAAVFLVAGGIGVAPFPMLAAWLRGRGHTVQLLFGARTSADLVGRDLLAACDIDIEVATDDGSEGHRGFVTHLLEAQLSRLPASSRRRACVYVCGPTPMMAATDAVLARFGTPGHFSVESFMGCGFGVCLSCVVPVQGLGGEAEGYARVCVDGPTFPAGRIAWSRSVSL